MQKVALVNSTTDTLKKNLGIRDRTDRSWFSFLLRLPARKRSRSILTVPQPTRGAKNGNIDSIDLAIRELWQQLDDTTKTELQQWMSWSNRGIAPFNFSVPIRLIPVNSIMLLIAICMRSHKTNISLRERNGTADGSANKCQSFTVPHGKVPVLSWRRLTVFNYSTVSTELRATSPRAYFIGDLWLLPRRGSTAKEFPSHDGSSCHSHQLFIRRCKNA